MSKNKKQRSVSHKNKTWKRILGIILALILLVGVAGAAYGFKIYKDTQRTVNDIYKPVKGQIKKRTTENKVSVEESNPFSVLLLGVDTGALGRTEQGRSDSMMVAALNNSTAKTEIVSIPRDTRTQIIGHGTVDKINHAYAFGGVSMSVNTVQDLLDVPIDYYVEINMAGIQEIVEAVGGIDVDVPFEFTYDGNQFSKGTQHLNGKQALAYSRMRHDDPEGDYGRQKRQRQVVTAVAKSAMSISTLANYQDLLTSMQKNMKTNLTFANIVAIQKNYRTAATEFVSHQLVGTGAMIDGVSYQIPTTDSLNEMQSLLKTQLAIE